MPKAFARAALSDTESSDVEQYPEEGLSSNLAALDGPAAPNQTDSTTNK